ncbi:MAG TPA: DUF6268 family outer membrane beta-barrel protein [Bacteroidia bacterium]|nr:DUF6268 family outer membrane beta-barrel protein [Bacteroidia bacterium]
MKGVAHITKTLIFLGVNFLFFHDLRSQDSTGVLKIELPKHYFNTVFVLDVYRKPETKIKDTIDYQSKRLKTYGVKQFDLSFYTPLFTTETHPDSSTISNTHILLTGNYSVLRPVFEGIEQHKLAKIGIGIRYIYNTGKKGVLFVDAAPFVTRDATYRSRGYFRLASTIVYSHNATAWLNWRLGVTKSFLWGNRFYWPFIGLRFGRLDKVNFSIQFPRSINLNMPVNSKLVFSIYTKPQGGMYNFSNHDSLDSRKTESTFNFTRYEINTGLRCDVRTGPKFNFYIALGVSSRNNITFYSEKANKARPRAPYRTYFYSQDLASTLYLNFGLVFKFGKTRSYYNNKNLYDAMNLNSTISGDGNAQIPLTPQRKSDINLESVRDLVDYNDF